MRYWRKKYPGRVLETHCRYGVQMQRDEKSNFRGGIQYKII